MEIFDLYKKKQVYRALASKDLVKPELFDAELDAIFENVFSQSNTFEQSIEKLSPVLTAEGMKTYRRRYTRFKSAHKTKNEKKQINVSQGMYDKLSRIRKKTGEDTTFDEMFAILLDPSDDLITDVLKEEKHVTFEGFIKALPPEYHRLMRSHIEKKVIKAYTAGAHSVPIDARKKTRVANTFEEELEQYLANLDPTDSN